MQITDHHIKEITKGNINRFKEFYEAFYPSLCKFCYEYVNSYDTAADMAQESMVRFWNSRDTQKNIKQAKIYLYTTARNQCLNHIRHSKVVDSYEKKQKEQSDYFLNLVMEEEVYAILHEAIDQLPHQTGNIIKLSLKGLNNDMIADELNISINTVKSLKKSGYRLLRGALKDHYYSLFVLYIALFY